MLFVLYLLLICLYWSLIAFISSKTGLFSGIENSNESIIILFSEMPFDVGSCCVKTDWLVCTVGQMTAFGVMRSFAEASFQTVYNVSSKIPFGGGSCHVETSRLVCVVNRLTGFCMVWVFIESFFLNRLFNYSFSVIYLYCC